jgi:hypothetical protein
MAFKVFESRANKLVGPGASISPAGTVKLNKEATVLLRDLGATHVLVHWDEERTLLGISVADESDTRGYRLTWHPRGSGVAFAAKAFFAHLGWHADHGVSISLEWQKKMLVAKLPWENLDLTNKQSGGRRNKKPVP